MLLRACDKIFNCYPQYPGNAYCGFSRRNTIMVIEIIIDSTFVNTGKNCKLLYKQP